MANSIGKKSKTASCVSLSILFHGSMVVAMALWVADLKPLPEGQAGTATVELMEGGSASLADEKSAATATETEATVVEASKPVPVKAEKSAQKPAPSKASAPKAVAKELPAKESEPANVTAATEESLETLDPNGVVAAPLETESLEEQAATEAQMMEEKTNVEPEESQLVEQVMAVDESTTKETAAESIEKEEQDIAQELDRAETQSTDVVDNTANATPVTEVAPTAVEAASASQALNEGTPMVDARGLRQVAGNRPPAYPTQDRLAKNEGVVELTYYVSAQGTVSNIKVIKSSGHPSLDAEAVRAISRYRYVPGQEGMAYHPVVFKLNGQQEQMASRLRRAQARNSR